METNSIRLIFIPHSCHWWAVIGLSDQERAPHDILSMKHIILSKKKLRKPASQV